MYIFINIPTRKSQKINYQTYFYIIHTQKMDILNFTIAVKIEFHKKEILIAN